MNPVFTSREMMTLIRFCEANQAVVVDNYSPRSPRSGKTCIAVICDPLGPVPEYLKRTPAGFGKVDMVDRDRVVHYWPDVESVPGTERAIKTHMRSQSGIL